MLCCRCSVTNLCLTLFVTNLCLTLFDPMKCRKPGFPVLYCFPELAQTHVHWVNDAIQSSHPLSSLSSLAFNLSQYPPPFFFNTAELKVHTNISILNKYTVYFFLFQHLVHYFIHSVPLVYDLIHMYVHMCIAYSYHHSPYQTEKHTENITLLFHRPI